MRGQRFLPVVAALALAVGGLGLTSASASTSTAGSAAPAAAPGGAVTAGCGYRSGPTNVAEPAGSWTQDISVSVCDLGGGKKRVTGQLFVNPLSGFNVGNVISCTAYIKITHVGVSASTKLVSCTAAVKNYGGYSDSAVWDIGVGSGVYRVEGYATVTTGVGTYSGSSTPSSTAQFGS